MRSIAVFAIALIATSSTLLAQSCPARHPPKRAGSGYDNGIAPSARQSLSGTIVYHQSLRTWLGFRTDKPVCGQAEFEIWAPPLYLEPQLERSRGCKAAISGRLTFEDREHHATPILLDLDNVIPDRVCSPKPELLELLRTGKLKPRDNVTKYVVTATLNLIGEGSVHITVRSGKQMLRPWQAYTHYRLGNGGLFSASCGYGFIAGDVSSTPIGAINFPHSDPELDIGALHPGTSSAVMKYTCLRAIFPGW